MFSADFWRSIPGILTAIAAILSASTGLIVAINQWRSPAAGNRAAAAVERPAAPAAATDDGAAFNGGWRGHVRYGWGASYTERMVFQADGAHVTGTVTFLGTPRGIQNGEVRGTRLTFIVPLEEMRGQERRTFQLTYRGTLSGGGILFVVEDSRGEPPVQFAASRDLPAP